MIKKHIFVGRFNQSVLEYKLFQVERKPGVWFASSIVNHTESGRLSRPAPNQIGWEISVFGGMVRKAVKEGVIGDYDGNKNMIFYLSGLVLQHF